MYLFTYILSKLNLHVAMWRSILITNSEQSPNNVYWRLLDLNAKFNENSIIQVTHYMRLTIEHLFLT